jgi:hypothetical protein
MTDQEAEKEQARWLADLPDPRPLSSYERQIGGDGEYALAARAVADSGVAQRARAAS